MTFVAFHMIRCDIFKRKKRGQVLLNCLLPLTNKTRGSVTPPRYRHDGKVYYALRILYFANIMRAYQKSINHC